MTEAKGMAQDTIKVDTRELEKMADEIKDAVSKTEGNVHSAVARFAYLIDLKAKEKLRGNRSGRKYKRGRKTHTASAPGEPPKTAASFLQFGLF